MIIKQLIKKQKEAKKYFSEKDIWAFAYGISRGMEYLHSHNIIHRDIKCLNIFLAADKSVKVISSLDWGYGSI